MGAEDELVDVVDDAGRVVRVATRAEVRAANLAHRSVFVVVFDGAGSLLAHQRAPWKDIWPGFWDIAFGGVLAAGESFAAGAARELAEEAGIEGVRLDRLGTGRWADAEVNEISEVFATTTTGPSTHPDGEVVATDWVSMGSLDRWIAIRQVVPDSLAIVRPFL